MALGIPQRGNAFGDFGLAAFVYIADGRVAWGVVCSKFCPMK